MSTVSAILTAAGESTRMNRPKPLLPWRGMTLLEHQIDCLIDGGAAEVIVVLGHQANIIATHVKATGARSVANPNYRLGKTTSIKMGLFALNPDADAILLIAVDQPRTTQIVSRMIHAHLDGKALITSPQYQGRRGHPIIFSASLKEELERISEPMQGIREILQAHRHQVNLVEFDDPLVRLDFNTPEEYESARYKYGI